MASALRKASDISSVKCKIENKTIKLYCGLLNVDWEKFVSVASYSLITCLMSQVSNRKNEVNVFTVFYTIQLYCELLSVDWQEACVSWVTFPDYLSDVTGSEKNEMNVMFCFRFYMFRYFNSITGNLVKIEIRGSV